jgi:hypothetical protein
MEKQEQLLTLKDYELQLANFDYNTQEVIKILDTLKYKKQ